MLKFKFVIALTTILFVNLLLENRLYAREINAASGNPSDVQNSINQASQGDVINIPAGTFTFNQMVKMQAGITLKGAGVDQTILRRTTSSSQAMIEIDGSNGNPLSRITGMTMQGVDPENGQGINIYNNCKDFRIDNMKFRKFVGSAITVRGDDARGVIDHNIFSEHSRYGIVVVGNGDANWDKPLELGTANAIYVEDNYMELSTWHHMTSNNGSKYVFRYNEISDDQVSVHAIDVHGYDFWPRGSRSYEIYNNLIKANSRFTGLSIRGGDGVIFENTLEGTFSIPIDLSNDGQRGNCSYPCPDQIRNTYIWNNTYNGSLVKAKVNSSDTNVIQENRDFFSTQKPGYTPYIYPHPLVSQEGIPLQISTTDIPNIYIGEDFNYQLIAIGGSAPYEWSISNGALPSGISLNGNTLQGVTNEQGGENNISFTVRDSQGENVSKVLSVSVISQLFSNISYYGDIQNWEPNNENYWKILPEGSDNKYVISTTNLTPIDNKLATYSLIKNRTFDNFTMGLKVKTIENIQENTAADFAIVFDYQNDDNYYYFILNATAEWSAVHKIENGSRIDLATANFALSDNAYHDFELTKINNKLIVKYDGTTILDIISSFNGSGRLGIGSLNDAAFFDDIDVTIANNVDTTAPAIPQNINLSVD